ncbi:MAG: hypothetical protein HQL06_05385 [Nitrospirae bacterium]|nr:hypothetical protein [Nitrospirota bacterium]
MDILLESRVDRLEVLMAEAIELHNSTLQEMRAMRLEVAELDRRYKEEQAERDRKYKESQVAFSKEMAAIDAKIERQNRALNKRLGEISNKQGTLVEDLIAPGVIPLISQYFKCETTYVSQRTKQKRGHKNCEVDLLLIGQDKVFMVEVKSNPDSRDVDKILAKAQTLADFFPNCAGKQIIPMLANIVIDRSIISYANKKGLYVVAYKHWEYLDILNFKKICTKLQGLL